MVVASHRQNRPLSSAFVGVSGALYLFFGALQAER